MTHSFRRLILSVAAVSLVSTTAFAADDAKPAPAGPKTLGYDIGVLGQFMSADPVLGVFYDRSQSVSGFTVGGFVTRRAENGLRLTVDAAYTAVAPKDGPWLASGKTKPESEFTEFRDFKVISLDFLLGHEFGHNGTFGFYFGGGIGLAIPLGTITSYDTTGAPNYDQKLVGSMPDKKNVPPVVPTVLIKMGPTYNIGGKGTLSFDAGLQNGPFIGTSLAFRL